MNDGLGPVTTYPSFAGAVDELIDDDIDNHRVQFINFPPNAFLDRRGYLEDNSAGYPLTGNIKTNLRIVRRHV